MTIASLDDFTAQQAEFEAAKKTLMRLGHEESRVEAIAIAAALVDEADDLGKAGAIKLLEVADRLQLKRAFGLLLVVCILAERSQLSTDALRQKEVQALIELGRLREAIRLAKAIVAKTAYSEPGTADYKVWMSAMGNVGRAHKQAYVNDFASEAAGGRRASPVDLEQSVVTYAHVWDRTRDAGAPSTYHGINAAALMMRAVRDHGHFVEKADGRSMEYDWAAEDRAREIALEILRIHETDLRSALDAGTRPGDIWTLATCGEAYLVLGLYDDAFLCYGAYAGNPENDAFKLASSLRQLEEVWGFDGEKDDKPGEIVRLLKTALLNLDKGVQVAKPGRAAEDDIQAEPVEISPREAGLMARDLQRAKDSVKADAGAGADSTPRDGYQAYFRKRDESAHQGKMVEVERLLGMFERVKSICAIEVIARGGWQRIGTGFVVDGGIFKEEWRGDPLILSNHHVVANADGALSSSYLRCRALFIEFDAITQTETEHAVGFEKIVWRSGERAHDTTILKPKGEIPRSVRLLNEDDLSFYLPERSDVGEDGTDYHVVILGFPEGGVARLSFDDELLLDHSAGEPGGPPKPVDDLDGRPERLHYRTPTLPGSSGSPVFDSVTWKLLGIHHRGRKNCPRIPAKDGHYEANEGIWLPSIKAAINSASAAAGEQDAAIDPAANEYAGDTGAKDPATGEFLGLTSAAGAILSGVDFPNASADRPASKPDDDVVMGQPLGGAPKPTQTAAPKPKFQIPGRIVSRPQDNPAAMERHLRSGIYSGNLDKFRLQGFETVIGDDNRTQIHETAAYPFRMICSLVMHYDNGMSAVGTGFLVGQRTVVTAGHCILPRKGANYPAGIEIRPGRSGAREPFANMGRIYAEKVSLHQEWSNRFDPRFDIGALHLNKEIGEDLGWFQVASMDPDALNRRWCHVTGYPGDKTTELPINEGGGELYGAEMWHHATPIEAIHGGRVYYPADTFGGQSGSPVYILDDNNIPTVVGIHAYGTGNVGDEYAMENNSAAWIDPALLQVIADWRAI